MRAIAAFVGTLSLASMPAAQETPDGTPRLVSTMRREGGLSGTLRCVDGSRREFFLEVSATRARLAAAAAPRSNDQGLTVGSAEELELLGLLKAWARTRFAAEEAAALLAPERLPDPQNQVQDIVHREQSLFRDLRAYEDVTRAKFTKVFAGRGTVTLSM